MYFHSLDEMYKKLYSLISVYSHSIKSNCKKGIN